MLPRAASLPSLDGAAPGKNDNGKKRQDLKLRRMEPPEKLIGEAVGATPLSIVLADARLHDHPITYVNRAFERLTLYSRDYAIGRNCRFLQGPETDPEEVRRISEGLRSGEEFEVTITNRRADGTLFRNHLLIAPIHDEDGRLSAYFGVQRPIDDMTRSLPQETGEIALLRELQHRVKNHLSMIVSMIRIQAARPVTSESLRSISRRIEALALLYEDLLGANGGLDGRAAHEVAGGTYLSRIASVVAELQAQAMIRVDVDCEEIGLPVEQAARLGLLLSEFLTNALQHAFEGRTSGRVAVRFFRLEDGLIRLSVEDDGIGMPADSHWPFDAPSVEAQRDRARTEAGRLDTTGDRREAGVGGSIVAALSRSLEAEFQVASPDRGGTVVTVDFAPKPV